MFHSEPKQPLIRTRDIPSNASETAKLAVALFYTDTVVFLKH